jgi:diadenylate cyclase
LTEETDAVVVAVSEETGAISYAYKGHLVRGVTAEELRSFLTSVFVRESKSRSLVGRFRTWTAERVNASAAPAVSNAEHK